MTRATIQNAKLDRIERDLHWIRRNPVDGPMISRFDYDHGNTIVASTSGKRDLLIEHGGDQIKRDCATLLQHVSPAIMAELMRGYRLARWCGLLGDGVCSNIAAEHVSTLRGHHNNDEHAESGKEVLEGLAQLLEIENRKPGGVR